MLQISRLYIYEPSIENYRKITAAELSQLVVTLWPRGKWIGINDLRSVEFVRQCSICSFSNFADFKFCPNCGALMQPEGEPDEKENPNEHINLLS